MITNCPFTGQEYDDYQLDKILSEIDVHIKSALNNATSIFRDELEKAFLEKSKAGEGF